MIFFFWHVYVVCIHIKMFECTWVCMYACTCGHVSLTLGNLLFSTLLKLESLTELGMANYGSSKHQSKFFSQMMLIHVKLAMKAK